MAESIKDKLIKKIDEIERKNKNLFEMDDEEEFMDGEANRQAGVAEGYINGLNYALKVLNEGGIKHEN